MSHFLTMSYGVHQIKEIWYHHQANTLFVFSFVLRWLLEPGVVRVLICITFKCINTRRKLGTEIQTPPNLTAFCEWTIKYRLRIHSIEFWTLDLLGNLFYLKPTPGGHLKNCIVWFIWVGFKFGEGNAGLYKIIIKDRNHWSSDFPSCLWINVVPSTELFDLEFF